MTGRHDGKGPTGDDLERLLRDINARMMRVARPFCRTQRCRELGIRAERGGYCQDCIDAAAEDLADAARERRLLGEEWL
jgi:hypothetical protein